AERLPQWRERAAAVLGGDEGLRQMLHSVTHPTAPRQTQSLATVETLAGQVLDELGQRRATWNRWHVQAQVHRTVRTLGLAPAEARAMEEEVTAASLDESTRLTPKDPNPAPQRLS